MFILTYLKRIFLNRSLEKKRQPKRLNEKRKDPCGSHKDTSSNQQQHRTNCNSSRRQPYHTKVSRNRENRFYDCPSHAPSRTSKIRNSFSIKNHMFFVW